MHMDCDIVCVLGSVAVRFMLCTSRYVYGAVSRE